MTYPVTHIAIHIGGVVHGDGNTEIRGVAPFETATPADITFAGNAKFLKKIDETQAGAVIVPQKYEGSGKTLLKVNDPPAAFAKVVELFHPRRRPASGIHPTATVGKDVVCGMDVSACAHVFIGDHVVLGDRVVLHPGVYVGDQVRVGEDTEIYPNVTILERCRIGSRVIIQAGTVIGSDGFGFARDGERYQKIPQIGIVQIDDDVEIGACNTIDRATFGRTWIQRGVKTDNLVQIAHNVTVGENSILVAQVGISGSTTIGKQVIIAGQAGISGHLTIGDGATVGPQSGVAKSVSGGEVVSGTPERPHRHHLRIQSILSKLPELKRKLEDIEKRLELVEKAHHP